LSAVLAIAFPRVDYVTAISAQSASNAHTEFRLRILDAGERDTELHLGSESGRNAHFLCA
jgi:hypothetical protein